MELKISTIIAYCLGFHLIISNLDLLISWSSLQEINSNYWQIAYKLISAFPYSIITVYIIKNYQKIPLFFLLGFLDGFSVYLKYNIFQPNFIIIMSVYFGIYTFVLIVLFGISEKEKNLFADNSKKVLTDNISSEIPVIIEAKELSDVEILQLWQSGNFTFQNEISKKFNINPVRVCRVLKKLAK